MDDSSLHYVFFFTQLNFIVSTSGFAQRFFLFLQTVPLIQEEKATKSSGDPDMPLWFVGLENIKGTALEKHLILDAFSV